MGHHNRHFAGDPYSLLGWWGPPTSTANFCEEDYAITLYIAEFMNTLTNLAYIYFAIKYPGTPATTRGRASRLAHEAASAASSGQSSPSTETTNGKANGKANGSIDNVDVASGAAAGPAPTWTQPDFLAGALWVLGIFSLIFHMTLKHATQYGDEIAMLILAGALLCGVWPRSSFAAIGAATSVVGASAVYLRTGNILHHVFCFNSMILVVGVRMLQLVVYQRPEADRRYYLRQFIQAVGALALGYTLWQLDLEQCSRLRSARAAIGLPWGLLLEMHGWWHILTALGASLFIRLIRDIDP